MTKAPSGNMKWNKRWTQISHRGKRKVKGECILHAIGHNLGVICRRVSVEQVQNLKSVKFLRTFPRQQVNDGSSSSVFSCGGWYRRHQGGAHDEYEERGIRFGDPGWGGGVTCS